MKVREENIEIERGGDIVESMFGISGKDSAHILNILRSKLYSNKILAVIREYCANAQDAHAEVGTKDKPIKVQMPNRFDPTFRVRDYGPGLSEDDVRNIYVMYGASTKRNTNNAIGQLGLGCKSAFAYTDKFNVVSWFGGEKKTYCAYIDETQCGKIALMATEKSEDPDGIEIQIPVEPYDFNTFRTEAADLLKYFSPLPEVTGIELKAPEYWLEGETINGGRFCILTSESDQRYYYSKDSHVIMGGIPYPIDRDHIMDPGVIKHVKSFLSLGVDIYVNIGDLEVTANREDLEYTTHTVDMLNRHAKAGADKAIELGSKNIAKAKTYREANERFHETMKQQSFWKEISKHKTWNGKPLDGMILPSSNEYDIYRPVTYSRGLRWNHGEAIPLGRNAIIFDVDDPRSWRKRIAEYIAYKQLNTSHIYVIKWDGADEAARKKNQEKTHKTRNLEDYEILKISQCKVPTTALPTVHANIIAIPRSTTHIGTVFTLKKRNDRTYNRALSKNWTRVSKIPDGIKHYIQIDKFKPMIDGDYSRLDIIDSIIETCNAAGWDINAEQIYGIKKAQIDKIVSDKEWIPFDRLAKAVITNSNIPLIIADYIESTWRSTLPVRIYMKHKDLFLKTSLAYNLLSESERLAKIVKENESNINSFQSAATGLRITEINPSVDLHHLLNTTAEKYPLASTSETFPFDSSSRNYYYYRNTSRETSITKALPHVAEYVKMIEEQKEKVA